MYYFKVLRTRLISVFLKRLIFESGVTPKTLSRVPDMEGGDGPGRRQKKYYFWCFSCYLTQDGDDVHPKWFADLRLGPGFVMLKETTEGDIGTVPTGTIRFFRLS